MRAWSSFGDGRRQAFTVPFSLGHASVHATGLGAPALFRFRARETRRREPSASRPQSGRSAASHIVFMYLGRRGLGRYTLELARAVRSLQAPPATFVLSAHNETIKGIEVDAPRLLKLPTFTHPASPAAVTNFLRARDALFTFLECTRPTAVVNLMPHVWTPLLRPGIQRLGTRFFTIVHDARGHPGDTRGYLTRWINSEALLADGIVTLSRAVADKLVALDAVPRAKIKALFHPDIHHGPLQTKRQRDPRAPLRLLLFGRLSKYKGLGLLVQAVELLRAEGIPVHLGVAGAGDIRSERSRLEKLGADVRNRWLADSEILPLLAEYDAIILPYMEASQSGVLAAAYGNCMPVIGTPVGALPEQILHERTGLVADAVTPRALANTIRRLAEDPALYERMSAYLADTRETRSMTRFASAIVAEVERQLQ